MSLDVVICTYNRPQKVVELITQLQDCIIAPSQIIVVDSSDKTNTDLRNKSGIKYVQSNHKNQPYQRFLGVNQSTSEYILFLDDDMEILDEHVVEKIVQAFQLHPVSGFALYFKDKHANTGLSAVPESNLFKKLRFLKRFKNWFTGYPTLKAGQLGLCGNRGKQPVEGGYTEYVSGGAFVAKREALFVNFNFQLFDLFEEKNGMGEDALIGYGLHKTGGLFYLPDCWFLHNDQRDSTYSTDLKSYATRVLFSRYYLSLEKCRLDEGWLLGAKIHYHWYALWRLTGLLLNRLLSPSTSRKQLFIGSWIGWKKSLSFKYSNRLDRNAYWENESKQISQCNA